MKKMKINLTMVGKAPRMKDASPLDFRLDLTDNSQFHELVSDFLEVSKQLEDEVRKAEGDEFDPDGVEKTGAELDLSVKLIIEVTYQ